MRPNRLHHINVFLAVIESGGISRAARRLGVSPSAVSRAISALESQIAVRLLKRSTRPMMLTPAGERYAQDCSRVRDALRSAGELARGKGQQLRGCLTLAVSPDLGTHVVVPLIVEYLVRYPGVRLRAGVIDHPFHFDEDDIDVGLHVGIPPETSARTLVVGSARRLICASPDYLALFGVPRTVEDLASHTIIQATGAHATWQWWGPKPASSVNEPQGPRITLDNAAAIEAARQGLGITEAFWHEIAALVATNQLQIVLPTRISAPIPIFLTCRGGATRGARVQAFIDIARARLASNPDLQGDPSGSVD